MEKQTAVTCHCILYFKISVIVFFVNSKWWTFTVWFGHAKVMPEPELFMTLHEGFQPFTKVSTPKELYRKFISWFLGMAILAIVFEKSDLKLNDFFFSKNCNIKKSADAFTILWEDAHYLLRVGSQGSLLNWGFSIILDLKSLKTFQGTLKFLECDTT